MGRAKVFGAVVLVIVLGLGWPIVFGNKSQRPKFALREGAADTAAQSKVANAEDILFRLATFEADIAHAYSVQPAPDTTPEMASANLVPPIDPPSTEVVANESDTGSKVRISAIQDKLIDEVARYRVEVKRLQDALQQQSNREQELRDDLAKAQRSSIDKESALSVARAQIARLSPLEVKQEQFNSRTREIETLREQLDSVIREKGQSDIQNEKLVTEVAKLRTELEQARPVVQQHARLSVEWEQKKAELEQVKTAKADTDRKLAELQLRNGQVIQERDQLRANFEKQQKLAEALGSERVGLAKKVTQGELLKKELQEANESLQILRTKKQELESEVTALRQQFEKSKETGVTTASELSIAKQQMTVKSEEAEKLKKDLESARSEIGNLQASIERGTVERLELSDSLKNYKRELGEKNKELGRVKNELMLKQTELRTFSAQPQSTPGTSTGRQIDDAEIRRPPLYGSQTTRPTPGAAIPSDVPVVEVIVPKVNLRSGPGEDNSPVAALSQGSRLTVEAREGNWYRVFTPNGSRAYVAVEKVRSANGVRLPQNPQTFAIGRIIGLSGSSSSSSSGPANTQPGTVNPEDRAFEELRSGLSR